MFSGSIYFLELDPQLGMFSAHLLSLLPIEDLEIDGNQATPRLSSLKFATFAAAHVKPAVEFCQNVGGDVEPLLDELSRNFSSAVWRLVRAAAGL